MFTLTRDMSLAQTFVVEAGDPAGVARATGLLAQAIAEPGDQLALWGLHHDEQDFTPAEAYRSERALFPHQVQHDVMEVPRPVKRNVIWVDRLHLLAINIPVDRTASLAGLYAGQRGRLALFVHPPGTTQGMIQHLGSVPGMPSSAWRTPFTPHARLNIALGPDMATGMRISVHDILLPKIRDALDSSA